MVALNQPQPGQKTTGNLPSIATPKVGLMGVDNGNPDFVAMRVGGGTVTLNGVTPITIADTRVTANSIIVFTLKTVGGTVGGGADIETITPGVGFTVQGTALDTSTYNYAIFG